MALKSLDRDIDEAIYPFPSGNVLVHDKQEHRGIGLTPRIGWLGMDIQTLQPDPWDRLPATAEGAPDGSHYWQGVWAAAMSAAELLIGRATRALDVDHRSLEAVEPRPFGIDDRLLPLIQIVDAHGNGAGFSACLGEERSGLPPILEYQ